MNCSIIYFAFYVRFLGYKSCHESILKVFLFSCLSDNLSDVPALKRHCRSLVQSRESRVHHRECIFHLAGTSKLCGKTRDRFIRDKRSGSRQKEKLAQCLTQDAEKRLKAAACQRNDEKLLIHIQDKGFIAIEVCYHKSCYSAYVLKCVPVHKDSDPSKSQGHSEAFEIIAKRVQEDVINEGGVLKISTLKPNYLYLLYLILCLV